MKNNLMLRDGSIRLLTLHVTVMISRISLQDIPPLTTKQLAGITRLRDRKPKVLVSVRVDAKVLEWLK